MKRKNNNQIAKELFQDYMLGIKTAFRSLDYDSYCRTNFYLRINKYSGRVGVTSNHPMLGGSSYAKLDIDYYSYQLPKVEFTEQDFELRDFLRLSREDRDSLILFENNNEIAELAVVYRDADEFIDDLFFTYLLNLANIYILKIEDVVELLVKRVEIPRNLQFAEIARKFDLKIQRKLFL